MRVLLLDTDKAHIRICRFLLKANSHLYTVTSTADAAALKLQRSLYDILLSDVDLFHNLQQEYPALLRKSGIKIYLFTDLNTLPRTFRALKETFDIFPKPLDLTKMLFIQTRSADTESISGLLYSGNDSVNPFKNEQN